MKEAKLKWLKSILQDRPEGSRALESVAKQLETEPVARVRRIRSQSVLCMDDVQFFSDLLHVEFPEAVYFFLNFKTGRHRPPLYPETQPIVLHASLREAVEASMSASRPRPEVVCRLPWPDELVCRDPERLIGGRDYPDSVFDLAIQYRALGRWFSMDYASEGYVDPRKYRDKDGDPYILRRAFLSPELYPPFELLIPGRDAFSKYSEFFTLYDLNDPETTAFAKRVNALWRRLSTNKVAVYDPSTRRVVDTEALPGDSGYIGKQALAHALEDPPRYPTWVARSVQEGAALMIGPRPRKKRPKDPSNQNNA